MVGEQPVARGHAAKVFRRWRRYKVNDMIRRMNRMLTGLNSNNGDFVSEMREVIAWYEFYDGTLDNFKSIELTESYGQLWGLPDNLSWKPTREIRNHTKKLLNKQARFMFGVPPEITFKPYDKGNILKAEDKRSVVDRILEEQEFWHSTYKAFLDCTIGKRVLLAATVMPGEPIRFKYYNMTEFMYEMNPHDSSELESVTIAYPDPQVHQTGLPEDEIWHRWRYEMRPNTVLEDGFESSTGRERSAWCVYEVVDGLGNPTFRPLTSDEDANEMEIDQERLIVRDEFDTGFSRIPCRVITNEGLTGDVRGTSDVKNLVDEATSYNKTVSDFRDSLRFKMFEPKAFFDTDSDALTTMEYAPNAVLDLKSDLSLGQDGHPGRMESVSSTFNWAEPAEQYLHRLKKDMYEFMDQPLPEQIATVPSAKALGFLFYDLIGRCQVKWITGWDASIRWVIEMIEEACELYDLYPEMDARELMAVDTNIVIKPNYPIPEDIEEKISTSIKEVEAKVKSRKTHIREFGDVEDESGEWQEILSELEEIEVVTSLGLAPTNDPQVGSRANEVTYEPRDYVAEEENIEDSESEFREDR